jgi:hypothetical protein
MGPAAAVILVAALLAALPGCDGDEDAERRPPGAIDEVAGSYGGVRMGASEEDVRSVFGEPGEGEGFFPLGTEFGEIGGAPAVRNWPPDDRAAPTVMRYEDVAFLVGSRGVFAFVVTAEGARTRRDVAVGDRLVAARRTYDVGCGEGVAGEALVGETPTYPYCRGTIGERTRIWFGEDPIRSITLARVGAG